MFDSQLTCTASGQLATPNVNSGQDMYVSAAALGMVEEAASHVVGRGKQRRHAFLSSVPDRRRQPMGDVSIILVSPTHASSEKPLTSFADRRLSDLDGCGKALFTNERSLKDHSSTHTTNRGGTRDASSRFTSSRCSYSSLYPYPCQNAAVCGVVAYGRRVEVCGCLSRVERPATRLSD